MQHSAAQPLVGGPAVAVVVVRAAVVERFRVLRRLPIVASCARTGTVSSPESGSSCVANVEVSLLHSGSRKFARMWLCRERRSGAVQWQRGHCVPLGTRSADVDLFTMTGHRCRFRRLATWSRKFLCCPKVHPHHGHWLLVASIWSARRSVCLQVLCVANPRSPRKCCPHTSHAIDRRCRGSTCASSGPSVLWDSSLRNLLYIRLALSLHCSMSAGNSSTSPHRRASATSSQNWRNQGFASAQTEPSPAN